MPATINACLYQCLRPLKPASEYINTFRYFYIYLSISGHIMYVPENFQAFDK